MGLGDCRFQEWLVWFVSLKHILWCTFTKYIYIYACVKSNFPKNIDFWCLLNFQIQIYSKVNNTFTIDLKIIDHIRLPTLIKGFSQEYKKVHPRIFLYFLTLIFIEFLVTKLLKFNNSYIASLNNTKSK